MDPRKLSLYLVTDRPLCLGRDLEWVVKEAVKGGATIVQLREKDIDTRDFVELGKRLKDALKPYGVPLIINDRIDVALAVDADGVHIGQSDMPYETARRLLGPDKIIGLSIETLEELEQANSLDVDYVAASPVFGTPTKTDTAEPWGLDGLKEFCRRSKHPVVAIGGMNRNTAAATMQCGTDGLAVVSAIVSADSPKDASSELLALIDANRSTSWTREVWARASKIYNAILELPFIKELADGTLPTEKFDRYIAQDEAYLGNYGRQMFAFDELLTDPDEKAMFYEFAKSGMDGEKMMHELLIDRFGINTAVSPSVVTDSYNSHSQAAVDTGNICIGLASLLPCMWVYNEVGRHIMAIAASEGNPYKEWIAEYSTDELTQGVNTVLRMADKYAELADEATRERMTREFLEATLYEYAFWDYGYNGEDKDYSYMNSIKEWI